MNRQSKYWVALSKVTGIGPMRMRLLLRYFGDAREAWEARVGDLQASGLDARVVEALAVARKTFDPDVEMSRVERAGARALTWEDEEYPARLKETEDGPPVLYVRGELTEADEWAVGVVGTRKATHYGREVTQRIVGDLAGAGITIVSGLARGVDTAAHTAALEAGGRTLAVLGSGVDVIYPSENRGLVERMLREGQGVVLSEYGPGTEPEAMNFPARNRIISGLSRGVLVVEAGARSGALITVGFALEQGRDVFAVPGPITSRMSEGPNNLLKRGAKVVTEAGDILEELGMGMAVEHTEAVRALPSDPTERLLLGMMQDAPMHIDELTNGSGLPASTVSAVLTMMELKGMVRSVGGMQYSAR